MKRTEAKRVSSIIDEALEQAGLTQTMARQRASFLWAEVAGSGINRHTLRRWVDNRGVLHIHLSSAPLKNELAYHRSRLLQELNNRCGDASALIDIQFH